MSVAQKFLFDNFIINDDNEMEKCDSICSINNENFNEVDTTDEVILSEVSNVEELKQECETVYQDPNDKAIYSQNQVDEMINNAKQDGYNQAIEENKSSEENKTQGLMMEIANKLSLIFAKESENNDTALLNNLKITKAIIKKLIPTIAKKDAHLEIEKFITDNYKDFYKEKSLTFYVNSEVFEEIKTSLVKCSKNYDFEDKYQIFPDNNVEITDCRIEWETGGIEKNTNDIWNKIDQLAS